MHSNCSKNAQQLFKNSTKMVKKCTGVPINKLITQAILPVEKCKLWKNLWKTFFINHKTDNRPTGQQAGQQAGYPLF